MRRTAAMVLAGVVQGAAVLVVVATLAPRLGSVVAILAGAILLLLTRPLQRPLDQWLRVRLGDREARRTALLRTLGDRGRPLAAVLADTLRLRYAAVEVEVDGARVRISEAGVPGPVTALPVEHHGARVGSLLLGPPVAGGSLGAKASARAGALAELAAPELAAARLRLVQEAERVRLGHELHD